MEVVELTERLFAGYLTEIDSEFRNACPLWSRIPESAVGKALAIIRIHSASHDRMCQLLKERCRNLRDVRLRALCTNSTPTGFDPGEWSALMAGDGAVWGKISVASFRDYHGLRDLAKVAITKAPKKHHEIVLKDDLPLGRATIIRFAEMKPPPWRAIIGGIEDVLKRGGWRKLGPWAKAAFEKQIDDEQTLRVDLDSVRGGFGFEYHLSLVESGRTVAGISYERDLGIGIGKWNRIDQKSLPDALLTLRDVISRLESLLGV